MRGAGLPDFVVKVALSHWYLLENEDDYPLVTELSFGFDATEADDKDDDRLEKFPPTVVAGANSSVSGRAEPGRLAIPVWFDEDRLPVRGVVVSTLCDCSVAAPASDMAPDFGRAIIDRH